MFFVERKSNMQMALCCVGFEMGYLFHRQWCGPLIGLCGGRIMPLSKLPFSASRRKKMKTEVNKTIQNRKCKSIIFEMNRWNSKWNVHKTRWSSLIDRPYFKFIYACRWNWFPSLETQNKINIANYKMCPVYLDSLHFKWNYSYSEWKKKLFQL